MGFLKKYFSPDGGVILLFEDGVWGERRFFKRDRFFVTTLLCLLYLHIIYTYNDKILKIII